MNHNKILGVSQNASPADIQRAFRTAAMEIHPDHNNSAEAAEAFNRIKQARDELLEKAKLAEQQYANDQTSIQRVTDDAIRATTRTAYSSTMFGDDQDEITAEEIAHIQELDRLSMQYAKLSPWRRLRESGEVRQHRRKIETVNRRICGKY